MIRICPIHGCAKEISPGQMMCRRHWFMVPRPLRCAINATWGRYGARSGGLDGTRAALADYRENRDEAIRLVETERDCV